MAKGNSGSVTVSLETLQEKLDEIESIDEILDAQAGSQAAGRRKVASSLMDSQKETWEPVVTQVSDFLDSLEGEVLAGVYTAIARHLDQKFGKPVSDTIDALVEAGKTEQTEKLSAEELESQMETRRERVKEYTILRSLLEMAGANVESVPEPKSRRGSVGPKGPRALSTFDYFVDGEALSEDQNSMTAIAKSENMKSAELKAHIESQVDFELKKGSIPDEWTAVLPSGKTLSATRKEEFVGADGFGPEEDDEDEGDAGTVVTDETVSA